MVVHYFQCLVYRDGTLISGSLDALVLHLVPTADYYPDRSYLFAFLLSSRLFVKPYELLRQVCDIAHQPQHLGQPPQHPVSATRFASNCLTLLSDWVDTFPYDFR